MRDVVTLGEAMVLLAAEETGPLAHVRRFSKHTAGAETNVAVGLARLGLGVGWVSRLGNDTMGQFLRDAFMKEGIDCSQVTLVSGARTGFMFKGRVDDGSDPPIEYHRQGSAASLMGPNDLPLAWLQTARHLHVTGVFAALTPATLAATQTAMATVRAQGGSISFDPNLRPALWASEAHMRSTINALAAQADWVLPGLDEGRLLTGCNTPEDIAQFYLDQMKASQHASPRGQGVVVKLGADGAYFATAASAQGDVPAFPVKKVIDTVGAGDAFAVGIISSLLEDLSVTQAVQRATWMGARAVQMRGDSDGLPTRAELDAAQLQAQH
jgi:sugar/nucleoside kinase (ribokinase family)